MLSWRRILALSLLVTGTALAGCSDSQSASNTSPAKRTIAVIPKGTSHEFWKSIHAGAVKASRDLDVEIIWKGPAREDDRDDQIKVVEQFVTRGVDGIVIAPLDDTALVRPLKEAVAEGIPVVVIDSGLNWDGYASFAATDNFHGGELAAEELATRLGGQGKVVAIANRAKASCRRINALGSGYSLGNSPQGTSMTKNQESGHVAPARLECSAPQSPGKPTTADTARALCASGGSPQTFPDTSGDG
jgi:ribose transport system substrate-binding protein